VPPAPLTGPFLTEEPAVPLADDLSAPLARVWARGEYLIWWVRGSQVPPLVTTSPPGTPEASAGVLGEPGTLVGIGDHRVNGDARSGARATVGIWLDSEQIWGARVTWFGLEAKNSPYLSFSPDGSQITARPFINAAADVQDAELVSFPGVLGGNVQVNAISNSVTGAEALLTETMWRGEKFRIELLGGYRYLRIRESLGITESLVVFSADDRDSRFGAAPGTAIVVGDQFDTKNEFQGLDVGVSGEIRGERWVLGITGKIALGWTQQEAHVAGNTRVTVPDQATVDQLGGLLALSTNIGKHTREKTALVPELAFHLGFQVTPNLQAYMGYTLLYWADVARPGDQIDLTVNTAFIPPGTPQSFPRRPAPGLNGSDLWVHGFNFGLEFQY
jgi:hypothetical protein